MIFTEKYLIIYFLLISVITVAITVYDKKAAKKFPKNRIPEKVLFLLALAGGSLAEFITMLKIRHKTKHIKFMVGLPVIFGLQVAVIILILKFFIL